MATFTGHLAPPLEPNSMLQSVLFSEPKLTNRGFLLETSLGGLNLIPAVARCDNLDLLPKNNKKVNLVCPTFKAKLIDAK